MPKIPAITTIIIGIIICLVIIGLMDYILSTPIHPCRPNAMTSVQCPIKRPEDCTLVESYFRLSVCMGYDCGAKNREISLKRHCSSIARYHGTAEAPRYRVPFFYGTSTVALAVLFSTAIPQLHGSCPLLTHTNEHLLDCIVFEWNCNFRLVFCRSLLNCTRFTYLFYVVLLNIVY